MELLERESHLDALSTALHEARAGNGCIALVSGEAGIGKTVLVEHFTRAQQNTSRVLWGACDALFTPRPLGPLHDMAAQAQSDLLARLTSESNRSVLFSTFLSELQNQATIVVFEDVHWADEATLDLLKYLGRRVARTSTLVVLTYRDDEVGLRHPLRALLGDLSTSNAVVRIPLSPLSKDAVRALVGERAMDAAALHRQTGGNPFFLTEVLSSAGHGIPATVRDAVLARAARLSLSGQAVLQAAAVIGPRIEPAVLAEVTGAEASAVEECLDLGMLVTQAATLAFRHELARQTILETISPLQKLALHRMTLDALRALPTARHDLTRLTHHAEAAGDREAILEFAPAAARQAVAALAHRAAAALFELAFRHADDLPPAERAQLLDEFSVECDITDRRPEAIEARRQAVALWHAAGQPLQRGRGLSRLALLLQITGQKAEAEEANRAALEILEPLAPNLELVAAYNMEAWLSLANGDSARGVAMAEKGIAMAQHFEEEKELPPLLEIAGLCWLYLDHARGTEYLERSLTLAHKFGHATRAGNIYANLSSIYVDFHEFTRAEAIFAQGLPFARERDLDAVRAYMEGWLAIHKMHRGDWAAAEEIGREATQRSNASPGHGPALIALGRLRTRRGEPEAMAALDEALDLLLKQGFRQREGMIRAARAEAAWQAGDRGRALEEARAALDLAVSHHQEWYVGELAFWIWRAGEAVDLPEWAAKPYALHIAGDWRAAAEEWERLGCPYEQARALADGDTDAQIAALELFERLGARPAAEDLRQRMRAAGVSHIPRRPRAATRENPFGLTARQLEILLLLTEGLSNAHIAARLHLSPKTVDHHVSAVLAKLNVHSREAAAELARQHPRFSQK
ncbi:MAG TPA: AAA family ATPase [Anaerolineae bacterium]|nr:AAA family ATPase [Anaerolineae bacterium]